MLCKKYFPNETVYGFGKWIHWFSSGAGKVGQKIWTQWRLQEFFLGGLLKIFNKNELEHIELSTK